MDLFFSNFYVRYIISILMIFQYIIFFGKFQTSAQHSLKLGISPFMIYLTISLAFCSGKLSRKIYIIIETRISISYNYALAILSFAKDLQLNNHIFLNFPDTISLFPNVSYNYFNIIDEEILQNGVEILWWQKTVCFKTSSIIESECEYRRIII